MPECPPLRRGCQRCLRGSPFHWFPEGRLELTVVGTPPGRTQMRAVMDVRSARAGGSRPPLSTWPRQGLSVSRTQRSLFLLFSSHGRCVF